METVEFLIDYEQYFGECTYTPSMFSLNFYISYVLLFDLLLHLMLLVLEVIISSYQQAKREKVHILIDMVQIMKGRQQIILGHEKRKENQKFNDV